MGIKCELCGVGLKNVEARREGIKFHRFPVSRPSVCKQWLETAGKPELHLLSEPNLSSRRICSRHFASTDYKGPTTRLLYHYAVPMKGRKYFQFHNYAKYLIKSEGIFIDIVMVLQLKNKKKAVGGCH